MTYLQNKIELKFDENDAFEIFFGENNLRKSKKLI